MLSKWVRGCKDNGFERGFDVNLHLFYPDVLMLSKGWFQHHQTSPIIFEINIGLEGDAFAYI